MATLEKGKLVWVDRDKIDSYLKEHHVPPDTRTSAQNIVNMCFEHNADAVVLFMDESTAIKNVKVSCYMPIYKEIGILEQSGYTYNDVDGCIFLDALAIENIRTITSNELLFTVKDTAIRAGYWREEYGIVALS
jgi:hypothetical protein